MTTTWKEKLGNSIPEQLAKEIDAFEAQISLRKLGKIEEKVFAETRLRRGAYGQRYDNGHRHDGMTTQDLPYPALTKGPDTMWDAPGMQRIKIPFGALTPQQMVLLAELAEEYSDGICAYHHPAGCAASLYPHRRHADDFPATGLGGNHHPRGLRQFRPQRDRLSTGRGLPYRDF